MHSSSAEKVLAVVTVLSTHLLFSRTSLVIARLPMHGVYLLTALICSLLELSFDSSPDLLSVSPCRHFCKQPNNVSEQVIIWCVLPYLI